MPYKDGGRAWRQRNPSIVRRHNLKRWGLTPEAYESMLAGQGGVCACCGKPESAVHAGKVRHLAIDHDHATGKIRGLLCSHCNLALGHTKDDPERLQKLIQYLAERR